MTLFSPITQVENDCNAKSTNGFMDEPDFFFFAIARVNKFSKREREMQQNSREKPSLTPPIFQQQYQLQNVISPQFFPRALISPTNSACECDCWWKMYVLTLDFETSEEITKEKRKKKQRRARTRRIFSHRSEQRAYKFRSIRCHRLIVVWNSITCAGSTEPFRRQFPKILNKYYNFLVRQKSYFQQVVHFTKKKKEFLARVIK